MMGFFRLVALVALLWCANCVESRIRHYTFDVVTINTTKLCSSKPIITVNGKFPGPTLRAREDDTVIVKVNNRVKDNNVTIHWHGVRQLRTGWSDGPAYITQCPIQPGQSYIYNFTLTGQRGTLLWHAHINWQRATVHGAIVVLPKNGIPYPYPKPYSEEIVVLGEWWKSEIEEVIDRAVKSGLPPVVSDSHTINGDPGPFPNCSSTVGYTLKVETGKTYLLRIVNAALNDNLFFKVASHRLVIVEVDGAYTKPFETDSIFIAPGQTTNALLTADRKVGGAYEITISPFVDGKVPVDERVATGSLRYEGVFVFSSEKRNAAGFTTTDELRSLDSEEYPTNVPRSVDRSLLFAIGVGMNPCSTCVNKTRFVASINNVTFVMPTLALLQAHYYKITGVYTDDFPATPPVPYDYTGNPPENVGTLNGTRVFRVLYNSTVQIVLQGTSMVAAESHPMHLHGFNFYVVGKGVGNYDPDEDPKRFNLVDPVERNTVSVPTAGWTAIRFRADNPGVWFFHCHLEVHTTWGLKMAFLVENGNGLNESILSPPNDLPKC